MYMRGTSLRRLLMSAVTRQMNKTIRQHTRSGLAARVVLMVSVAAALVSEPGVAFAHHSYAMFDTAKATVVSGTVAKLEWVNPHVFLWVYVEKPDVRGEYDLYAFEGGSVGSLTRSGWTKHTFKAGDKVSIHYFPLKDGRTGGQMFKAVRADGTQLTDPFSPQGQRELAK